MSHFAVFPILPSFLEKKLSALTRGLDLHSSGIRAGHAFTLPFRNVPSRTGGASPQHLQTGSTSRTAFVSAPRRAALPPS